MKQRLQWMVPVLWLLAACSHVQDEEQGVSRQALASDASSCPSVTLAARRDWQPSRKVNGEIELLPARTLLLPSVVSVTAGNAGNKKVKLNVELASGAEIACTYRGGAGSPHPTAPADVAAGLAYVWESCGGGLIPGASFSAKELELEVQGGDSQLPSTAVSMVFAVLGCAADAGGEAGTDGSADAGFDAGREAGVDAGLEGGAGDSGAGPIRTVRCTVLVPHFMQQVLVSFCASTWLALKVAAGAIKHAANLAHAACAGQNRNHLLHRAAFTKKAVAFF